MFDRSAHWYDLFYADVEYEAHARRVADVVRERLPSAASLLDVACGTGRHLEHLCGDFDCEGVDIEPTMLEVARQRLGERVPLHVGDMCTFDLGRRFDAVTCLFSSIGYARDRDGLRAAFARMAAHLAPGGVMVVEPWILPEAWREPGMATVEVVGDGDRKLARAISSYRRDELSVLDLHYVLVEPGRISTTDERHELGLFGRGDYLDAARTAGLEPVFDEAGLRGRGLVIATAPA